MNVSSVQDHCGVGRKLIRRVLVGALVMTLVTALRIWNSLYLIRIMNWMPKCAQCSSASEIVTIIGEGHWDGLHHLGCGPRYLECISLIIWGRQSCLLSSYILTICGCLGNVYWKFNWGNIAVFLPHFFFFLGSDCIIVTWIHQWLFSGTEGDWHGSASVILFNALILQNRVAAWKLLPGNGTWLLLTFQTPQGIPTGSKDVVSLGDSALCISQVVQACVSLIHDTKLL